MPKSSEDVCLVEEPIARVDLVVTSEIISAESRARFLTKPDFYSGRRSRKREMGRRFVTTARMATLQYVGLVT